MKMVAAKAGEVLEVEWKEATTPQWLSVPKALIKVRVNAPLVPGFRMKSSNGKKLRIYFKYEKLFTFCYDCGILGHDQGLCKWEGSIEPNKYGPWLRYDENADLPPPEPDLSEESDHPKNSAGDNRTKR